MRDTYDDETCLQWLGSVENDLECINDELENVVHNGTDYEVMYARVTQEAINTIIDATRSMMNWVADRIAKSGGVEEEPIEKVSSVNEYLDSNWIKSNLNDFEEPENDPVNHPAHYTQGGIECIDAIRASMTPEEFKGFLKGNAMKYLWRYENKGHPLQDIEKGIWYSNRLKKFLKTMDEEK
jgi:hypothetical protein